MFKILLFSMFLAITLIYGYLLPYIVSLVILLLSNTYPAYYNILINVKITKICRVLLAILYVETSIYTLVFNADLLLQTEPLGTVILQVFSDLVSMLLGTVILLYKDCDLLFNKIAEKINPLLIQLFLIFFWFKFIFFYIELVIILLIYSSSYPFDYILVIMSVPFIHYNYITYYTYYSGNSDKK